MHSSTPRILLVEDNQADVYLVQTALEDEGLVCDLQIASDGEEVLRVMRRVDSGADTWCPEVIILDWNLPRYNGDEILAQLNNSPKCSTVPVILFTSSDSPNDRELAERHGVAEYFRKPTHFEEFMELGPVVRRVLNGSIQRAAHQSGHRP